MKSLSGNLLVCVPELQEKLLSYMDQATVEYGCLVREALKDLQAAQNGSEQEEHAGAEEMARAGSHGGKVH